MNYERWGTLRQVEAVIGLLAKAGFLLALAYGAFAYGTTRENTANMFAWLLYGSGALWMLERLMGWQWPRVPWFLWACVVVLLVRGWLSVWAGVYTDALAAAEKDVPEQWEAAVNLLAPVDTALAFRKMFRDSALLLTFLMLVDTLRDPVWRRWTFWAVAGLGTAMAGFAWLQLIVGGPFQLVGIDGRTPISFAVFRYWGNAADFLNLTWPAIVGAAILAFAAGRRGEGGRLGASLWAIAVLMTIGSCFLNLSKAGNVLVIVGLVFFAILAVRAWRQRRHFDFSKLRLPLLVAIVPLLAIAISFAFLVPWQRWQVLDATGVQNETRFRAYGFFLQAVKDAGWLGFGPGNFQEVYLGYFPEGDPIRNAPFWTAHQDYIQTAVEWGWGVAGIWFLLLAGGGLGLWRKAWRRAAKNGGYEEVRVIDLGSRAFEIPIWNSGEADRWMAISGVSAFGLIALHSMVDFPMQIMILQALFLYWVAMGYQPRATDAAA